MSSRSKEMKIAVYIIRQQGMLHFYMANDLRLNTLKTALATLYLRGGPGGSPSASLVPAWRAQAVLDILRVELSGCEFLDAEGAAAALAQRFLWEEAAVLRFEERWSWASSQVAEGSVVSILCPEYPMRWRAVLGSGAPPVLYASRLGPSLALAGPSALPLLGLVGCRSLSAFGAFVASSVGASVAQLSQVLISGGAEGADTLGAEACLSAGGSVVEVLPHGDLIGRRAFWASSWGSGGAAGSWLGLSLCPPGSRFSTPFAMERNALIYSGGLSTFVAEVRFGQGGTWVGARDCLRRRLGSLLVALDDSPSSSRPATCAKGARSLCALGAVGVPLSLPACADSGAVLAAFQAALAEAGRRANPLGLMVSEPFASYGPAVLAS